MGKHKHNKMRLSKEEDDSTLNKLLYLDWIEVQRW